MYIRSSKTEKSIRRKVLTPIICLNKGIDKILKKVGEECTELVIAAKNPDPEEIKYEMSDFLYHAMVLMVERGVTWEDIRKNWQTAREEYL